MPSGFPAQALQADQPFFSSTSFQVTAEEGGCGIKLPEVVLAVDALMSAVAVAAASAPVVSHTRAMIWCLPVVICTVSLKVAFEVFCLSTRLPST